MATWADATKASNSRAILPAGTRNYKVTGSRVQQNDNLGVREAVIDVVDPSDGSSYNFSIPLEAGVKGDPNMFAEITGGAMGKLGFVPQQLRAMIDSGQDVSGVNLTAPLVQSWAHEFTGYLHTLNGSVVELFVKHVESTKAFKDNGDPFVNDRVYPNKVVSRPQETPVAAGGFVPVSNAADDDIPFMWDGGSAPEGHHLHH